MHTRDLDLTELKGGGYLATPDGNGPHPGVVVIHEAYGLDDHIKNVTRRFAAEGYAALAVDLFTDRIRAICMTRYMAGILTGSVNRAGIDDLKSGLTFLAERPNVDAQRVGAVGFCMGGGFAIAWACTDSRLKAVAPFYATNPRPIKVTRRLCPVVGSYPEKDFTAGAARTLDRALTTYDIDHDIKIYPNAEHSFFNDTRGRYNKDASDDAWSRLVKFFNARLK